MSRAQRRAAERRSRNAVKKSDFEGWRLVVMSVVTFAMVFSAFGATVAQASTGVRLVVAAIVAAAVAYVWWFVRTRVSGDDSKVKRG